MHLRATCVECGIERETNPSLVDEVLMLELHDSGLHSGKCSRGHTVNIVLQNSRFEVLFELGVMALVSGFLREAVSSIAVALERFYEFYIRVVCYRQGLTTEQFDTAWGPTSRQSERQFGAFLFSYLLANKTPLDQARWELIPAKESGLAKRLAWAAFRNNVTHHGYLPSSEEATEYADLIFRFIYSLIGELRQVNDEAITQAVIHTIWKAGVQAKVGPVGTMLIPTVIALGYPHQPTDGLRPRLEVVRERVKHPARSLTFHPPA